MTEGPAIPLDGLILGWGPMLPFPVGTAMVLWLDGWWAALALRLLALWGAAILVFLSGVRRGLSFRTVGGPRLTQLAMFAWLFTVGLAALALPAEWALWPLAAGYLSLLIIDPVSARAGEVPLYFARLRPWQMAVPLLCLAVLILR